MARKSNFEIAFELGAKLDPSVKRAFNDANKRLASFGNSLKNVTKTALGVAGGIGITKALSGAFNMVRNSMDSAFSRIDTMEQFSTVMEVMTGSAETANKALETTTEIVKGTAFGLDVAAGAVQNFVTSGMEVDTATKIFGSFADAVAFYTKGTNDELASVSDAISKMSTKGKVDMEQLGRIIEMGIPAIEIYAQATGQSAEQVSESISKGKISTEEFLSVMDKAFQEGTEKFPAIAGAAKDAGASWQGTFDNMRAAVARGVTNIIKSIDNMLESNGLPDMRTMIADFGSRFESVLTKVGEKIPVVTNFLMGMYEKAKPGIEWIKNTGLPAVRDAIGFVVEKAKELYNFIVNNWSTIKPIIVGLITTLGILKASALALSVFQSVTGFIKKFQAANTAARLSMLGLNGAMLANPAFWLIAAFMGVIAIAIAVWKNWDTVKEWLLVIWESIKQAVATVGSAISNAFTSAYNWVVGLFSGIGEWFMEKFMIIQTAAETAGAWISEKFQVAYDAVTSLFSGLGEWFGEVMSNVTGAFKSGINAVIGLINNAIGAINKISVDIPDWVPEWAGGGKTFGFNIPQIPYLAEGGITTGPTLAMIGEGAEQEAVLPLSKLQALLNTEPSNSSPVINYSPVINIEGNADERVVEQANIQSFRQFERMMKEYLRSKDRNKFN